MNQDGVWLNSMFYFQLLPRTHLFGCEIYVKWGTFKGIINKNDLLDKLCFVKICVEE